MTTFRATADAIRSDAEALAAATSDPPDWAVVRTRLLTTSNVSNSKSWTYAAIGEALGADALIAARRLMQSLAATNADLHDAHNLLLLGDGKSTGLRLDLADRQSQIADLITAYPDHAELLTAVKQLGVKPVSVADQFGVTDTSEAAIAADWSQAKLEDLWIARSAVIKERIGAGTVTTIAEAVAVLEA